MNLHKYEESHQLASQMEKFFRKGGKVKQCPNGDANWPGCLDPIIEKRSSDESIGILIYIGHEIENVDNDYNLLKRERE